MKKLISLFLVLVITVVCTAVVFAEMGVQVIGGPSTETLPVSLDDIKLNVDVTIDGYGILTPTAYKVQDTLGYYRQGKTDPDTNWYNSGQEAEYVLLRMDILNLSTREKEFIENVEVKVVYDDKYEYAGWAYQYNYNNKVHSNSNWYGTDANVQNVEFVIAKEDVFPIGSMYQGHYSFGATLPNAVVNSKAPLRMIITMDGNEITYNIRK